MRIVRHPYKGGIKTPGDQQNLIGVRFGPTPDVACVPGTGGDVVVLPLRLWPTGHNSGRLRAFRRRLKDREIAGIACERVK